MSHMFTGTPEDRPRPRGAREGIMKRLFSERQGFIAMFLDSLKLSATGTADNPIERSVSAAPSTAFEQKLANAGTVAPFQIGAGGVLWEYAKHLAFLFERGDVAFGAQFVHLMVYEVCYCEQGEICGPGYRAYVGGGIQPQLYFVVSAERNRRAQSFPPHTFTISYDPNAWTETQETVQPDGPEVTAANARHRGARAPSSSCLRP